MPNSTPKTPFSSGKPIVAGDGPGTDLGAEMVTLADVAKGGAGAKPRAATADSLDAPLPAISSTLLAYESSETFFMKQPHPGVRRLRFFTVLLVLLVFFAGVPLLNIFGLVGDDRISTLGKYLSLAVVALGIDLIWGYTGILSLCQALFFCLGAYAFSMHLSLPEGGGIYHIPQLMDFAYYAHKGQIPAFWEPFRSGIFAVAFGLLFPGLLAAVFGFFIFRSRVRGVYFSIITQAVAWGSWLLISRNEMILGGTNGMTNFYRPFTADKWWVLGLYWGTLGALALGYLVCRAITRSRTGRVMVAIRDKETRLYFAGYRPYAFKVFAFSVAAMIAALGGMLYAPQVGIISPQQMDVPASITMVIWVALGGRGKLWGAIFGTLLVNYVYSATTSDMPAAWELILGLMFITVVLFFPDGFVGIWDTLERRIAHRAGVLRCLLTAVPPVAMGLFVLAEATALMPPALEVPLHFGLPFAVKGKYLFLLAILAVTAGVLKGLGRRDAAAAALRSGTPEFAGSH